ncbi:MAG: SMC-Scp complex subunit ScpB [Candidatus Helarchaeota archaeon]
MNHIELLQALMFLRGADGISLSDIYNITGKKDMEYALFLLSTLEESFKNTPIRLKFIPTSKKYQLIIPPELITILEERQVLTPILSKAARATLACIIMNLMNEEPVTISLLKKIRGSNVTKHLKELEEHGYISRENNHITITNKLISEIDISSVVKELSSESISEL